MSAVKPAFPDKSEEDDASIFLRDESPYEEKDKEQVKSEAKSSEVEVTEKETIEEGAADNDDKKDPSSEDAAVAAAAAVIQATQKEDTSRPWPIDRLVNRSEFEKLPSAVRESLVDSADFANGHTYIRQIEPKSFEGKSDALEYVIKFADHEGFTFSKREEGENVLVTCDHDQVYMQTRKRRHPDDEVSYALCPFQAEVVENDGLWTLNVICAEHNHGPTGPAASAKRRRFTYFQKTLQEDFVLPKTIKHNTAPGTPREESAIVETSQVDQLKGLVGALRFDNALLQDQVDEYGQVTHLFWTTTDCVEMLAQYPEVLFINFTRSPNVPPLVHIVGMTAFHTTFEVGYAFISDLGLVDFRWVLYSLKDTVSKHLQRDYSPSAVITHRDSMLIGAVDNVFENTSQICVTQLMREINDKAHSLLPDSQERRAFIKLFQVLVDSETPDIYAYNESDFRKKFAKTKLLEFVSYHWLIYKSKFVRAWVDQHRHFNNYSMGKAESAQATIKDYAEESGGDLLKIYYRINCLLKRKKIAHEELVECELEKCPVKFFVPFYDDVRFKISTHALEMIKEQHELYLEAISVQEPLHRCTRMFTTTTGLPCKHTLSRPVTMEDCHPHWWLSKHRPMLDSLSESDRLANELTSKFERTVGLVKQHFLNYSSLESREFMLMNMIKYFSRAGVENIDARSGLLHNLSSTSLSSLGSARTPPPATPPPRSPAGETSDGSPLTMSGHHLLSGEESDGYSYSGAEDKKMHGGSFNPGTPRRCGRCNQVGHNARTCGQRLPLNGSH